MVTDARKLRIDWEAMKAISRRSIMGGGRLVGVTARFFFSAVYTSILLVRWRCFYY